MIDAQIRENILNSNGSLAISASAGSGKTTIMIKKLLKVIDSIDDHKTVAALTFTVKASKEIKDKAIEIGGHSDFLTMTNDSFIEYEIIRPFLTDALGYDYTNEFLVSYENKDKSETYEQALEKLNREKILGTYTNTKQNFKFELAKNILQSSEASREYLSSKYFMLFLDEYQDTDKNMHELFMYLRNELGIELFIVGDTKQAIYLWRGASENIYDMLEDEGIEIFELITNFRSHIEIVNYANLVHNNKVFDSTCNLEVEHVVHCKSNDNIEAVEKLIEMGELDLNKSICFIINYNDAAKQFTEYLNEKGYNILFIPRTPLDDGNEHANILKALASYILDYSFTIYDLVEELRIEQNRSIVNEVEKLLFPITELISQFEIYNRNIKEDFYKSVQKLADYLGLELDNIELNLLLETVTNQEYHPAFIKSNDLHNTMTVFGSKGLEFDQVVSFSEYYNFNDVNKKNNHYVCVTRAKEKFIMIENINSSYSETIIDCAENMDVFDSENIFKTITLD